MAGNPTETPSSEDHENAQAPDPEAAAPESPVPTVEAPPVTAPMGMASIGESVPEPAPEPAPAPAPEPAPQAAPQEEVVPAAPVTQRLSEVPPSPPVAVAAAVVPPRKSSGRIPQASPPVAHGPGAPLGAYEAVARSAKLPDLVALTLEVVGAAATARQADVASPMKVQNHIELAHLTRADADTAYGNALKVLELGPEGAAERALAQALWAHAVAEAPRSRTEDEDRLVADVLWLATHTAYDATPLLDRALGDDAADLWTAIADRVKRIDAGRGGALGRAEAIVGCAALASSSSKTAEGLRATLGPQLTDPVLGQLLGAGTGAAAAGVAAEAGEMKLTAQLVAEPRGPVVTTLLAVTGLLFVLRGASAVARVALAYRTPTEVSLSSAGVRVKTRVEMLGRTLREQEQVIAKDALVRVVREVRYPRVAFYAGLLALVVGSYVGVRALVDGVRAASPSLLAVGLVIVAFGVAIDFVLGSVLPGSRGRCRLAFVPKTGRTVWVGDVDAKRADEVLARVLRA